MDRHSHCYEREMRRRRKKCHKHDKRKHKRHHYDKDVWFFTGKDETNRACNDFSKIDRCNVKLLEEKFKAPIGADIEGGLVKADLFIGSVSADKDFIYLTTHNQADKDNNFLDPTGYVMKFKRSDGTRVYSKKFSDYSGIWGDYARGTPAIHKDMMYLGSGYTRPQTWNGAGSDILTFGFPSNPAGKRTRMYGIDKVTGEKVWETELGRVATNVDDDDNFKFITQSALVVEMKWPGRGKIPVVFVGTSSGNSFIPYFSSSAESRELFSESAMNGSLGATLYPTGVMTDVGSLFMLDGRTGEVLSETRMGPEPYVEGDKLRSDSLVGGSEEFRIWHVVQPEDVLVGGELNPVDKRYEKSKLIMTLLKGQVVGVGNPLVGQSVIDNEGNAAVVAVGAVPDNLDGVVVTLDVVFKANTTEFQVVGPQPSATVYDTTTAELFIDVAEHRLPARIEKVLREGDVLTKQDAYQSNYLGASVWGSTPVLRRDRCGKPEALYIATGQSHFLPLDESIRFDVDVQPGHGQTPLESLFNIKQKVDAFKSNKTQLNLNAYRKAVEDRTQDLLVNMDRARSVRGDQWYYDSLVVLDLRKEALENLKPYNPMEWSTELILNASRRAGFDTWHIGFHEGQHYQFGPAGSPDAVFVPGFTDIQAYYGHIRGDDGDFGQGPILVKHHGDKYLVGPGKSGLVTVVKLTSDPFDLNVVDFKPLSYPGILGGCNYGAAVSGDKLLTVQANDVNSGIFNDPNLKNMFPPPITWYKTGQNDPKTIEGLEPDRSYLSRYDVGTGEVVYEEALLKESPPLASVTNISCSRDVVFVQPNSKKLQARSIKDGKILKEFLRDAAGNSSALVMKNELYMASGRNNFFAQPGGTNYTPEQYLYAYKLADDSDSYC
jgi:hypothetical protein